MCQVAPNICTPSWLDLTACCLSWFSTLIVYSSRMWSLLLLLSLHLLSRTEATAMLWGLDLKLSHPSNSSRFSMSDILGKLYFLPVVSLKSGRIWATCARFLEDAFLSLLPRARTQKYVPSLNVSLLYQFLFLWFTHCKYYLIRFLLALCKRSEVF